VTSVDLFLDTPDGVLTGDIWVALEEKPFTLLKRNGRPRKILVRQ
jgi:hypothetical protein